LKAFSAEKQMLITFGECTHIESWRRFSCK